VELDWKPAIWGRETNTTARNAQGLGNHSGLVGDAANVLKDRGGVHEVECAVRKWHMKRIRSHISDARIDLL
jgi:hypothetical protein